MTTELVCLLLGGPTYEIHTGRKVVAFEMHPYCGPTPVHKVTGDVLTSEPTAEFWDAIERWQAGGSAVENGKASTRQWCAKCKGHGDELKHIGGRNYKLVGKCKRCNGGRLEP